MRDKLDAWIADHVEVFLNELSAVMRIPSVKSAETAGPGAPFGAAIGEALQRTLSLCQRAGMQVRNFDGYAGHAEFGGGDEIVGMLGHLDVVPAGDGWSRDPWGGEITGGFLWGRGASDDKGPTFAALFGAWAVMEVCAVEGIALPRRIRLIFGCDEESEWECMAHYFGAAGQPKPNVAFTPDAAFPLIYAEKGSFTAVVARATGAPAGGSPLQIVALRSGLRSNMVPADAVATLAGDAAALDELAFRLQSLPGIRTAREGKELVVTAEGRSAHGSTPDQGDNAAVKLLSALAIAAGISDGQAGCMRDLAARAATDGSEVGIAGADDVTGALTNNLGVVDVTNDVARATFNVRYPATWDGDDVTRRFTESLATTGWAITDLHHTPPLYVPLDQEPVRTLLRVYRERTGDSTTPPRTMGGRTYATAVAPNGVAFGADMPGDPEMAHKADERISVERLLQCAGIYAEALYELARRPAESLP